MNKIFIASLISMASIGAANCAVTPWWEQPTICRLSPSNCYAGKLGAGYDAGMWDAGANCWGMKFICPDALTTGDTQPVAMGRNEIAGGANVKRDFDTDTLNGDCFGVRRTTANGTMASVDGTYVNVWCSGILENADEQLPNGEITLGAQPTCDALAENGYAGVLNGKCYGKYYNMNEYMIECDGSSITPTRLILLNGADYNAPSGETPADKSAADAKFNQMQAVSKTQRAKYFKE